MKGTVVESNCLTKLNIALLDSEPGLTYKPEKNMKGCG